MKKNKNVKNAGEPIIGIHIDLKGVLFKPSYFPQLMEDLASQKINTILVEYEDIFPFKGLDITFNPADRWSEKTFKYFLECAISNKIEVIPLQQCLGHLEYLLRWQKYRKYAEYYPYPSTICLSNKRAKALVADMLTQIMTAHPFSRFVHLGMDEAHKLGTCPECRKKGDVLSLFLNYLEELCDICAANGKTPIIWTDMLEDHFKPGVFDKFRNRVIMAPWDYAPHSTVDLTARIAGFRVSRKWLDKPDDPKAPPISNSTLFFEDMPESIKVFAKKYRKEDGFLPIFQARMWSDMGFKVIGASVVRSSGHLAIMPDYNAIANNITTWANIIKETKQLGIIGTSWARGTTFCPPSFSQDLIWHNVSFLSRQMGKKPLNFWDGIPAKKVDKIISTLSRCKKDWQIEDNVIKEMKTLRPKIKKHVYEWDSLILMTQVTEVCKKANFALHEVEFFHANNRPVDTEWQRRIDDQKNILKNIADLRRKVIKHFSQRYCGDAFREWCRDLFDLWEKKLKQCMQISMQKKAIASKIYSRLK